jgi:dihydrofolate synthase/folylpolyglutamate synthase
MFLDLPAPRMLGAHQVSNAGVAAMALLALDEPRITPDAIAVGIATAQAPGRMQPLTGAIARLAEGRPVLLDGGHNPHGANAIAAAVQSRWSGRAVAVIGMLADKDVEAFVAALAPALSTVVAVAVRGPRPSAPPERIAAAARAASLPAQTADSLPDAVRQAALITPPAAPILICGSFALAGEALCLD